MPAAKHDFSIEQGSSFRLIISYKDIDRNIIPLNNWCARLIMKTAYKEIAKKSLSTTLLFDTNNTNYSLYKFYIDGATGVLNLLIPSDVTNDYDFDTAKYDIEMQSPDDFYTYGGNYTLRILYGNITINKRNSGYKTELDCQL